jgi:hypothetical protein
VKKKFLVVKQEDILHHLNNFEQKELARLMNKIQMGRKLSGKENDNFYLVVNTDEPYADQIIEIMKANGHYG